MSDAKPSRLFEFGELAVEIWEGSIVEPAFRVDAVVSSDDNYLSMGSGVARLLADRAGEEYVRTAQTQGPVTVTSVIDTRAFGLPAAGLKVKRVLHAAVIDYDTWNLPLERAVRDVTANVLRKAEELGLTSVLFPAFATGSGGLDPEPCSRQMCEAFKAHLAGADHVRRICLMLRLPGKSHKNFEYHREFNRRFMRQAELVLGVPYDPALGLKQSHDLYGRAAELHQLEQIVAGGAADGQLVTVVGGRGIGKSALLDRVFRSNRPVKECSEKPHVARVTFGRLHANTPGTFIFRRLLLALKEVELDKTIRTAIDAAYADESFDGKRLVGFLTGFGKHYHRVAFLIDDAHRLLELNQKKGEEDLWRSFGRLGASVQLVLATHDDERYEAIQKRLGDPPAQVRLTCVPKSEAEAWHRALFERYLGREPRPEESGFLEHEGGRHPYALSLAAHALISAVRQMGDDDVDGAIRLAGSRLEAPRRQFFDRLMAGSLSRAERKDLEELAAGFEKRAATSRLVAAAGQGDASALRTLEEMGPEELQAATSGWADEVARASLKALEEKGLLVDTPDRTEAFAPSFEAFLRQLFPSGDAAQAPPRDRHLEITLLSPESARQEPGAAASAGPSVIPIFLSAEGGRVRVLRHPFSERHRVEFLAAYERFVEEGTGFAGLADVGGHLLTYFTGSEVGNELRRASTVKFVIGDELRDLPWELILESAYQGEMPFRVGRCFLPDRSRPEHHGATPGKGKIRALLVGDPTGDLQASAEEVRWLREQIEKLGRWFHPPTVLLGSGDARRGEGRAGRLEILGELRKGYDLVHYSGHSCLEGEQSGWELSDGDRILANELTSGLVASPPALVFGSSCQSGAGGAKGPVRYDNQAFDLPAAFLGAGVPAYIGTLWKVDSTEANLFTRNFYEGLLSAKGSNLAECLRRAKNKRRHPGSRDAMAYVLYGDPRTPIERSLPALAGQPDRGGS